ncbi:NAD(P)-dependent oxidoreductase [Veillonella sp. R32]|uniref:NAD(P)-dependent oxidoreductase n=1 Tax=Veillonella sp. R32 TaxID=2021312 RepID=UPI00138962E4|nr:NAD(P)-dependent oxidoreductase [Veillonella sp. R32]KAF1682765.1 NADH-flavin reductase [Veillonella sp. R32]
MKIAVVSSNGKVGRLVVAEALRRGFEVTGFDRSENKSEAKQFVKKDIFDITADDLAGFDAVVDAFGTFAPDTLDLHTKSLMHLADAVANTQTRLLVVGGAGSLYVNKEHTLQLLDTPEFPKEYYPLAKAQTDELVALRKRNDVKWTFVSPAAVFDPEGKRTGEYILGGEEFTLNERGESVVSYADYAVAMVDEIETGNHMQQRISVVGK